MGFSEQTPRRRLIDLLTGTLLSSHQLAQLMGISERQVEEHLTHVVKTIARDPTRRFVLERAECRDCAFAFRERTKLTRPSRCPVAGAKPSHPLVMAYVKNRTDKRHRPVRPWPLEMTGLPATLWRQRTVFRSHPMNTFSVGIMLVFLLGSACGPDQAAQQLEIARLEERQNNLAHAKELYEKILDRYPESPAAETARARLAELAGKPSIP